MRTAFDRVDIIDVGVYVLREGVVVLHGHLDRHAVLFGVDVDDRFGDGLTARGVQVFDELLEALFRIEMVADVFAVLVPLAFVQQVQVDAFVQECQLTQAVGQDVVLVFRREREDTAVGFEGDRGSAIVAGADHFDRRSRSAFAVRLAEYFAVAVDFGDEQRRECVHARNTHAVQLNILTGETGAGKSILIGSIQSALGAKIPKDMIRHGCDSALIELIFHTKSQAVQKKMEEFEIPFEDGEIIISRRITNNRVINKVNDISVTIGRLKELSPLLLDLSGQHENQLLLKPQNHLKIIDSYHRSVIAPVKEKTASLYHEYQELQKKLSEQNMGEEQRIREMEFLKYEIQEIEEAQLRPGEDESLETEYQKVSHAKEILSDCAAVHEVTAGQNGCAGDLIGLAVQRLYTVSNLDAEARGLTEQLQTIDSLLNDFNRELSSYIDSMEFDGEQFAEIEERLNLINHLKAKYGDSIEKIQKYHDNSVEKYEKLSNYEEYISEIKRELSKVKEKLDIQCERLTALRKEAAIPLTKLIKEALLDLNFLDVVFEIAFEQSEHYSALGKDNVCFMISTNPGQAVRPLHEIASGGELSRIMLAIKSILADEENIETLIFDEIDTGISGRTAQKVSERLAYIAKKRQVIAITHLPQIAAMADSHYLIEKTSDANSTISNIYPLSEEESVKELARMLGGVKITEAVLQNAREMRALAKQ